MLTQSNDDTFLKYSSMKYTILSISSTTLNTIVTIISIICTIISGIFLILTRGLKKKVENQINVYDLFKYHSEFHALYLSISDFLISTTSNRGGACNELLHELNTKLRDFNILENRIPEEDKRAINNDINWVLSNIACIYEGTAYQDDLNSFKTRLDGIDRRLITIVNKMK